MYKHYCTCTTFELIIIIIRVILNCSYLGQNKILIYITAAKDQDAGTHNSLSDRRGCNVFLEGSVKESKERHLQHKSKHTTNIDLSTLTVLQ